MSGIEVWGTVNEEGRLEFEQPAHLPLGNVRITIEPVDIDTDEEQLDKQFASSKDVLKRMALQAIEEDEAGLTQDFDPDSDPDTP